MPLTSTLVVPSRVTRLVVAAPEGAMASLLDGSADVESSTLTPR